MSDEIIKQQTTAYVIRKNGRNYTRPYPTRQQAIGDLFDTFSRSSVKHVVAIKGDTFIEGDTIWTLTPIIYTKGDRPALDNEFFGNHSTKRIENDGE